MTRGESPLKPKYGERTILPAALISCEKPFERERTFKMTSKTLSAVDFQDLGENSISEMKP